MKILQPLLYCLVLSLSSQLKAQYDEIIFTKGIDVHIEKPIAVEELIILLENESTGIGEKINVFIEPDAAGTFLPPLNVRNVSVWTLLKTIAPHAGLSLDYADAGRKEAQSKGILKILVSKKPNHSIRYVVTEVDGKQEVHAGRWISPKEAKALTSPIEKDLLNSTSPKEMEEAPKTIPLKTRKEQMTVIPLGQLKPKRWHMHVKRLSTTLKNQLNLEDSNYKFDETGRLLILRQAPEKLHQAETLANAYLASMTEIERQVDTLLNPIEKDIRMLYFEISVEPDTDNKQNQVRAEYLEKEKRKIETLYGLR